MTTPDLTAKYAPHVYGDVVGQPVVTQYLQGLTRHGRSDGRHCLFQGSVGSGKTSLARIYAKALHCNNVDPETGSPCGGCDACQRPRCRSGKNGLPCNECELCRDRRMFEFDTPRLGRSTDEIMRLVNRAVELGKKGPPVVIFIDEAHTLSPRACVNLLLQVELQTQKEKPTVVFLLATTDPAELSPALRSRLKQLYVAPLFRDDAITLLKRIAISEGLAVEPGSLELVVRFAGGQPRDLISALEIVIDFECSEVRLADVKQAFGYDQVDQLEPYFFALAEGDRDKQLRCIENWRQPNWLLVSWIKSYLTSFYVRTILGHDFHVDAVVDSLNLDRDAIANTLMARLGLTSRDNLRGVWKQYMWFWTSHKRSQSEEVLALELTKFHDLVNEDSFSMPKGYVKQPRNAGLPPSSSEQPPAVPSPGFLGISHIRQIVNAASFLVQDRGRYFNLSFQVELTAQSHAAAAVELDDLIDHVEDMANIFDGQAIRMPAIRLLENSAEGTVGYVVASLPDIGNVDEASPLEIAREWLETRPGVVVHRQRSLKPHEQHWGMIKSLINIEGPDEATRDLLAKLGVGRQPRRPARIHVEPLRIRGGISEEDAYSLPLTDRSTFPLDQGRFDVLFTDWEREAHHRRAMQRIQSKSSGTGPSK